MKDHRGLFAGVALLLVSAPCWSQDQSNDPTAGWQAVVACAKQGNANRRHACIDSVLREAGVLDPAREAAGQRESFGTSSRDDEQAEVTLQGVTPSPQQAERQSLVAAPRAITKIETAVADSLIGGDRLLVVATAEGAIWKQMDGSSFRRPPEKGAAFSIEEGALGSYRCKLGSNIYRCRRVD